MDIYILLKLDIFTLMIMALGGSGLSFILLSVLRVTQSDIPGISLWWGSSLLALFGQFGFASLQLMPSDFGVWSGYVLMISHMAFMLLAQRHFFRQPLAWRSTGFIIVLFAFVLSWVSDVMGQMAIRTMVAGMAFIVLSTLMIIELRRYGSPEYSWAIWLFIVLYVWLIVVMLAKMLLLWEGLIANPVLRQLFILFPYISMLLEVLLFSFIILMICYRYRALELSYQASHDMLTGLFNRRGFIEHLASLPVSENGALVMVDIDNFKCINDRFGHAQGDKVLTYLGWKLKNCPQSLAARFGGEEFVILYQDLNPARAFDKCQHLCEQIAQSEVAGISFTVSMGFACWHGDWNFDRLFNQADEALYQAKLHGKNQICQAA